MKLQFPASKLRWRFMLSHLSIAVISIAVAAGFTRSRLQTAFVRHVQEDSIAQAQLLADEIAQGNSPLSRPHELDALTRRWAAITHGHWTVSDSNCRVLGDSGEVSGELRSLFPSSKAPALSGKVGVCIRSQMKVVGKAALLAVPIRRGGDIVGVVRATVPLRDIDRKARAMQDALVVAAAIMLAFATLASLYWAKRLSDPLREMEALARQVASGRWGAKVPVRGSDEIASLAASLNHMAAELRDQFERIQRFARRQQELVADVSHELRTPVATIVAAAETLQAAAAEDPEGTAKFIETVEVEARRLSRLVEDLLRLARLDAGTPLQREEVSLREVVEGAVAATAATRASRDLTLTAQVPEVQLSADRDALVCALTNLLTNATRHTPDGGRIEIAAHLEPGHVDLTVSDTGEGIAPEHLPCIFERFYRADASRTSHSGGAGLGLALVSQIVQAHGGTVSAASTPGEGTTITLRLPCSS